MDSIIDFFLSYGYWGMLLAAFLAGSFFPFSSEAVMTGLVVAGLDVWRLCLYALVGNSLGGMLNYGVGRLGREDWIYRLFRVKADKMARARHLVQRYGAWMGLLSWLPVLGSVITISMGLLRVSVWKSVLSITAGKAVRYVVWSLILSAF